MACPLITHAPILTAGTLDAGVRPVGAHDTGCAADASLQRRELARRLARPGKQAATGWQRPAAAEACASGAMPVAAHGAAIFAYVSAPASTADNWSARLNALQSAWVLCFAITLLRACNTVLPHGPCAPVGAHGVARQV